MAIKCANSKGANPRSCTAYVPMVVLVVSVALYTACFINENWTILHFPDTNTKMQMADGECASLNIGDVICTKGHNSTCVYECFVQMRVHVQCVDMYDRRSVMVEGPKFDGSTHLFISCASPRDLCEVMTRLIPHAVRNSKLSITLSFKQLCYQH
jgi:hypothetical protein